MGVYTKGLQEALLEIEEYKPNQSMVGIYADREKLLILMEIPL